MSSSSKKRARTSIDGGSSNNNSSSSSKIIPTWSEVSPKIETLSKEDIISCLSSSWNNPNDDIRHDIVKLIFPPNLWVRWTSLEDETLRNAVEEHGDKFNKFQHISTYVFKGTRTGKQCNNRWQSHLKSTTAEWTQEEDDIITKEVTAGNKKWSAIATKLPGHISSSIKERWYKDLDPEGTKKGVWDATEMQILRQAQRELGNKWGEIAKRIPGRNEFSVKNRWYNQMVVSMESGAGARWQYFFVRVLLC